MSPETTLLDYLWTAYVPSRLNLSARGAEQLAVAVHSLDSWRGSPARLCDLSPDMLVAWLRALARSRSPATVNSKRQAVLSLWRHASEHGLTLPPNRVPKLLEPDRLPVCWTHGLCWEHVLLREGKVILPAAADKAGAARPKPLHPIVVKHLLRIRGDWPEVFLWPRSEWVFYREWHRLQSAAGLSKAEQIRFHQIKATSATHYATSESPWVLQKMADHASILTSQHYVDPTAALRSAVDRFPLPAAFLEGFRDERRPALGG